MKSSFTISSSKTWFQMEWFRTSFLFLLFIIFSPTSVSPSTTPTISYSAHCASIVPEAIPTSLERTTYPLLPRVKGHYTGGDRILGKNSSQYSVNPDNSFSFRTTRNIHRTTTPGIYNIEAYLTFRSPNSYYHWINNSTYEISHHPGVLPRSGPLRFLLRGFWSESSGKLCMVGSASWYSEAGNLLNLNAVLKLNFAKNSTIFTSMVNGTLESLSYSNSSYFEPIAILAFPPTTQYNYTLVSEDFDQGCSGGIDMPANSSLDLRPTGICSMLSGQFNTFKMEYAQECDSLQNCTPFGGGIGYLPHFMSLYAIQCSDDGQKLRLLVHFPNSSYPGYYPSFDPSMALVAEGSWDGKRNRLCIVGCRILNSTDSLGNAHVGDCSIRLSLRYPAVWSIRNRISVEGHIWTNKTAKESGYFDRIAFQSSENNGVGVGFPGFKYEYTEIDRANCTVSLPVNKKGERYPNGESYDMRFDMLVRNSKTSFYSGNAVPISVGDHFFDGPMIISDFSGGDEELPPGEGHSSYTGPLNISYKISFRTTDGVKLGAGISLFNLSSSPIGAVVISAEGVYDSATGHLCMVGCRDVSSFARKSNDSMDCEIRVQFQFPPVNGKNGDSIKGSIKSMRLKNDSLYFEHLSVSSTAIYYSEARRSIWRMDLEITMVLISTTLACVFVGLQLFHVKKHPGVPPFMSLVMLVILTLGHMIPLVLNFEALYLETRNRQNVLLGTGGWLEVNEVIVRVVTMVAFLLQFRLLQQAWTARLREGNDKGLWVAEKKALFVSLPLYIMGGLIALSVNWMKNSVIVMNSSGSAFYDQHHSLWGDLRSYAGLVLDGFLFPQILLNVFQISRERALSRSFYIGTTFVRLVPHAYDLYRSHSYVRRHFDGSYMYANPRADYYSTAWDIIIPCVGMLFAGIIYLQQRFGGRCILPQRFRRFEAYEKVPVVSSE